VAGILRIKLVDVALDALHKLGVRLRQIRSTGGGWIVTVAGRRGPRVEVAIRGEALGKKFGADDLAVFQNQAARRLVGKQAPCNSRDKERVADAEQQGGKQREADGSAPDRVSDSGGLNWC
jgi:hypothetical protein